MSLQIQIDADIKAAMLARDKDRLNALRAIKSAILLELTKEGGGTDGISPEAGLRLLQKLHKQRAEAAAIYHQQGRPDLAGEDEVQARVIEAYLPKRMSEAEVEEVLRSVITELGATDMKAMGKVIIEANNRLAGRSDGATVSGIVKRLLSGG